MTKDAQIIQTLTEHPEWYSRRVLSRLEEAPTGCLLWTGALRDDGYARVALPLSIGGTARMVLVHRVVMLAAGVELPPALVVDHICRVRSCANRDHLRVVSNRDNVLAGENFTAANAHKTHCDRGHLLSGPNVRIWTWNGRSGRGCRSCKTATTRARRRGGLPEASIRELADAVYARYEEAS